MKYLYLLVTLSFFSCAGTYRTVDLNSFTYTNNEAANDSIDVSYSYDIQYKSRNKRYSKKEKKNGLSAVAINLENKSSVPVTITKEKFQVFSNGTKIQIIDPSYYTSKVKQTSVTYLFHGLWGPWRYSYSQDFSTGRTESSFFYLPIGLAVGLINLLVAESANSNHKKLLVSKSIFNKEIKPGERLGGILLIKNNDYTPLNFKLE